MSFDLRRIAAILMMVGVFPVVGCSNRVTVPRLGPADVANVTAAGKVLPPPRYRIEPGDVLQIRSPLHSEMNQDVAVRPDGRIEVPQVGEVDVGALTPEEVERRLRERTKDRVRDAGVEVTIASFAPRSIYVTGEVGGPGAIPFRK